MISSFSLISSFCFLGQATLFVPVLCCTTPFTCHLNTKHLALQLKYTCLETFYLTQTANSHTHTLPRTLLTHLPAPLCCVLTLPLLPYLIVPFLPPFILTLICSVPHLHTCHRYSCLHTRCLLPPHNSILSLKRFSFCFSAVALLLLLYF